MVVVSLMDKARREFIRRGSTSRNSNEGVWGGCQWPDVMCRPLGRSTVDGLAIGVLFKNGTSRPFFYRLSTQALINRNLVWDSKQEEGQRPSGTRMMTTYRSTCGEEVNDLSFSFTFFLSFALVYFRSLPSLFYFFLPFFFFTILPGLLPPPLHPPSPQ